jgi:hypothetical protein
VTALVRPKLRAATAFRYVGGVAPTPTDWFVIGERFDEEEPNEAMATIVHLRPGDTQVLGTLPTRAVQLQASRMGLCVLGNDGVVRVKPRVAGAGRKASREAPWVSCAEHIVAVGGSLRQGWCLQRQSARLSVLHVSLETVGAMQPKSTLEADGGAGVTPAFLSDEDGYALAVERSLWLGDGHAVAQLELTAPIHAMASVPSSTSTLPSLIILDEAGRLGRIARNASHVTEVQWLGQTDVAVDCIGVVGTTIVLGSRTRGLFVWQDGQVVSLRPSLRATHMNQVQGGVLITSDLFVAHYDGVDFMARDLSSAIRAAEGAT